MVTNPRTGKRIRNKSTGRNYKKEYATYDSKPPVVAKRVSRPHNLRVVARSKNRSFRRMPNGKMRRG